MFQHNPNRKSYNVTNKKYQSLINADNLDVDNMIFNIKENDNFIPTIDLQYRYNEQHTDKLCLQTDFISMEPNVKSFINYSKIQYKNRDGLKMELSTKLFNDKLLNNFHNYDIKVDNLIKDKYNKDDMDEWTCKSRLISNIYKNKLAEQVNMMDDFRNIKVKFLKNNSSIINYNISKKYAPFVKYTFNDEFESNSESILWKILTDKKEIRLSFSIFTWINKDNKYYGSYLIIQSMEVKYKNGRIKSIFDNDKEVDAEINEIII